MRLRPRPPSIGPNDGFQPATDLFGYADFGERLANLVERLDQPLTILLDGPWGSGKSIFIKQWAGLLRDRSFVVLEFNAFANDHHEDAFVALAAEIVSLGKQRLGGNEPRVRRMLNSAKKAGVALMPTAARIGIRTGTLGLVSLEDIEQAGEAAKAVVKELGDEAAKAAERAVSYRLRTARDERLALDSFRSRLKDLAEGLRPEGADPEQYRPLIFIIDELDRCRPSFAINLLERVKHLFSVPGVVFVLVTNLEQLGAAVRGAYGQETDGLLYLEKFYDLRVALPMGRESHAATRRRYIDYLWRELELNSGDRRTDELVQRELFNLAEIHRLSLRTLERVATHVSLAYAASGINGLKIAPLVAGLAVVRQVDPEIYEKARAGKMSWSDAKGFFQFEDWPEGDQGWSVGWWRLFTDEGMAQEEVDEYWRTFFRYNFRDRFDLVPWAAEQIDGFTVARE